MSLLEIQQLIKRQGLTPQYLPDSMMKQITWDDQWIGYDDDETFAAKKAWADSKCFGGTMVWSIDFQVSGSGDSDTEKYGEVVYIGSEVFAAPTAQCPAPCVMVFPPSTLSEPKVITMQPYTATLQVGTTTTVVAVATTSTTTVTVVNFFNQYINTAQQAGDVLTLRPSFQPPPVRLVVTGQDGKTTTRTVLPPPLGGGLETSSSSQGGSQGGSTTYNNTSTRPRTTAQLSIQTEFPFLPPPTPTTQASVDDYTRTLLPPPPGTEPPTTTPWPTESGVEIKPVTDTNKPPPPGGTRMSCRSWFFFLCISWFDLGIEIEWWDVVLPTATPVVTIGPGPPPPALIKMPAGWGWRCSVPPCVLPPWPVVTAGGGGLGSLPPKPVPCEPVTATLTIQSTLYGTTTTDGTVRTTETRSFSSEFPLLGCALTDIDLGTTKTACIAQPTPRAIDHGEEGQGLMPLAARADDDCEAGNRIIDAVIYPSNHLDEAAAIGFKAKLTAEMSPNAEGGKKLEGFTVIESTDPVFVAFVYIKQVKLSYVTDHLLSQHGFGKEWAILDPPTPADTSPPQSKRSHPRHVVIPQTGPGHNKTAARGGGQEQDQDQDQEQEQLHRLSKRMADRGSNWGPSHLSIPPRRNWLRHDWITEAADGNRLYKYQRHESECADQFVYILENAFDPAHHAFDRLRDAGNIEALPGTPWWSYHDKLAKDSDHATKVASIVAGMHNGVCPGGKVTLVRVSLSLPPSMH
jgi:chitinase